MGWGGNQQTSPINNQQDDKLHCLKLNPGRHDGHNEEE